MTARRKPTRTQERSLLEYAADQGRLPGNKPPLAERMRPTHLDDIVGQSHLLGPGGSLRQAIAADRLPSMILWGEPGCGKTTLASVVSRTTAAAFEPFSAVLSGVGELRELIQRAIERRRMEGRATVLFVDEIHRFNRAQQDAFLPHVERGVVTLIGATTENPSFAINNALLSRTRVFRLRRLEADAIEQLLRRALSDPVRGIPGVQIDAEVLPRLAANADGDARRALSQLELLAQLATEADPSAPRITPELLAKSHDSAALLYDKSGDQHYNLSSALIKSMRGSDPDAAIYWLMRMLDAGEEPLFVLRRLIIFASEDVGNADPRALQIAVNADQAFQRLGMPEGLYAIAQACLYLAACPKSNRVGTAFKAARQAIERTGSLPVPPKLLNPDSQIARQEGHGRGYRYPHDYPEHFVPGETYLPDALRSARFYQPSTQGLERSVAERLDRLRQLKPKPNS